MWLHVFATIFAAELLLGETKQIIEQFMNRVDKQISKGIHPYPVFDGPHPPCKDAEKAKRRQLQEHKLCNTNSTK